MSLTIENIGPIEHLELDAKPGTITVLRGMNGEGKSTALDAISAITRGAGKLESRDNTTGGRVDGFGVTIRVGRGGQNRRTGDLEVTSVEDRLSIADFVDPNIKDPCAADARRLKALVTLAGVKADPELFHSLAGGKSEFVEIVRPETLEAIDPIVLAEKIKRDFEAASRIQTTRAERLFGEIKALTANNDGIDLKGEHDTQTLQSRLESCLNAHSAIQERAKLAEQDAKRRAQAQAELDRAEAAGGMTLAQAEQRVADCHREWIEAVELLDARNEEVSKLRQALKDAIAAAESQSKIRDQKQKALESANDLQDAIEEKQSALSAWRQTLDAPAIVAPSADEIWQSDMEVIQARKAYDQGVLIRSALERKAKAEAIEADRAKAEKKAEFLRDAARQTMDVLAETVKGLVPGLKLDPNLRIIVPHRKRKECFFADLSHGERWRLALDIAVSSFERIGERGVLAIPQEAWEGLDGKNRKIVAEKVAETDLIVFTAEADRAIRGGKGIDVDVIGGAK
jgi:energy-coupling factor transporter ATP-binding protein EcfA2